MKIVTSGNHAPEFAKTCWQSQREYAERHGFEWVFIWQRDGHGINDRYHIILDHADREKWADDEPILWLDWDVLISPDAPSILDHLTPSNGVHLAVWDQDMAKIMERAGVSDSPSPWYNIGVHLSKLGALREIAQALTSPVIGAELRKFERVNQAIGFELATQRAIARCELPVKALDSEWHRITLKDYSFDCSNFPGDHFVHFAGHAKYGGRRPYA